MRESISSSNMRITPHVVKLSFFEILKMFPIWSTSLCMTASLMCLTFKEPLLQIRLNNDNIPVWMIGVFFSMDTITYTFTSLALNFIPEKKKNFKRLVCIGAFFFLIAMFLSGPVPGIFPDSVIIIGSGILVGGIGGALVNNNCVPALTKALESDTLKLDQN